jgi:hypothetical protein
MAIEQTIEQAKVILSDIVITISEQPITIVDIVLYP